MPPWRFSMLYDGLFTRPAGLIYGGFDETKIPRVAIPPEWPRFLGLDFGGVNTAGIFFAQERDAYHKPTGRLFAYREYKAGGPLGGGALPLDAAVLQCCFVSTTAP